MELQAEKRRIIQIIENLPELEARQVIDFVDDLDEDLGAPQSVQIKDKSDLDEFLRKGIEASKNNRVCSLDETLKMLRSFQYPKRQS